MFRPLFILIILLFPLSQANSKAMTLEEFYKVFTSSEAFKKAKGDVDFFVSHFHKDAEIFEYDHRIVMNCLKNYEEGNEAGISKDKCFKGEVFFKTEFHIYLSKDSKKEFSVGYVSGVIDFEDLEVTKKLLPVGASFYAPLENKPVEVSEK